MRQSHTTHSKRPAIYALVFSAASLLMAGLGQRTADANHLTVTAVKGSAENCRASTKFGEGATQPTAPTATVTLPASGSAAPITATAPCTVRIQIAPGVFGPTVLSTGPIVVSTQGTLGSTGSVTSTATIGDIGVTPDEALQATSGSSTCSASESGVTGSTTITNGLVETAVGVFATVPTNPAPNTSISGVNGAGDTFTYTFNEQTVLPDGSLRVRAIHLVLQGPIVTGDVFVGEVNCGVTTALAPTTTTTVPATTTTVPATTTTTVPATTTTTRPATTTTTVPATTTTTRLATTTTTVLGTTTTTVLGTTTTTVAPTEEGCRGVVATIVGTPGDDDLEGTSDPDVIVGLGGNDRILGLGGDDIICGGGGNDRLVGGSGGDRIVGGEGADYIVGDAGSDVLVGSGGGDTLRGGLGDDKLDGKDGTDDCRAGAGTDTVLNCEI